MTDLLHAALAAASPSVRDTLEQRLAGDLPGEDALTNLLRATGPDLRALVATADALRRQQAGDAVTWVVNRNINFTNVCVKSCSFCAFSRDLRSEQGYLLPVDEVVRRAREAADVGATEVCVQAGLVPQMDAGAYVALCRAVHEACPELHIHAFSPEEVRYGCQRAGWSVRDHLLALRDAGLGSLPGTSAEILDEDLRQRMAPGRLTVAQWIEVVTTAHELGIPTTATMMFGHIEQLEHRVRHLLLLRSIQQQTGGFTEFVPLSFVHHEAPLFARSMIPGVQAGPTGNDVVRTYAVARVVLGDVIPNLQASWVKEGPRVAQLLLDCGVNDLGGTLINESISTTAGAEHGQRMTPAALVRIIRDAGRVPVERDTRYRHLRVLDDPAADAPHPLDLVEDAESRFGSYQQLAAREDYRFRWEPRRESPRVASAGER